MLLALSTSGNSKNVIAAAEAARQKAMTVVALTGASGGKLAAKTDILLAVPATDTPLIQQVHICLYHYLCAEVEVRIAPHTIGSAECQSCHAKPNNTAGQIT